MNKWMDGWMGGQGHPQPPDSAGGWTAAWHGPYFSARLPAAPSSLCRHKLPPLPPISTVLSAAHSTELQEGLLAGLVCFWTSREQILHLHGMDP